MKTKWNPTQYEKFKAQRSKPFYDLLGLIENRPFELAIDLGCGTGELTSELFHKIKPRKMIGIDSSPEMLSKSFQFQKKDLSFELADIENYDIPDGVDLLVSNAALQWVPNHEELIPKLLEAINLEGQVAIQVPSNFDHPSHRIAANVAKDLFPEIFKEDVQRSVLSLDRYAELLYKHGFKRQIARCEVYPHPMASSLDVIEWTKGTLLTRYQSKLTTEQFDLFVSKYGAELVRVIGSGEYFYAFKRTLLWGVKGD